MKKIGLTLLFVAATGAAANAQVGFELGLNMADLAIKSGGTKLPTTFKPGFAIGIPADIALGAHVYFEPGVFYDMTGCKVTSQPTGKYSINTITVPLNFEYKTGEKCGNRFFIGIGPYIGYNVGGSVTTDAYGSIPSASETIQFGNAKGDFKSVEVGAGVNFGYLLRKRLYARAHYQLGLTDLNASSDGSNTVKPSAFGITIGYLSAGATAIEGSPASATAAAATGAA